MVKGRASRSANPARVLTDPRPTCETCERNRRGQNHHCHGEARAQCSMLNVRHRPPDANNIPISRHEHLTNTTARRTSHKARPTNRPAAEPGARGPDPFVRDTSRAIEQHQCHRPPGANTNTDKPPRLEPPWREQVLADDRQARHRAREALWLPLADVDRDPDCERLLRPMCGAGRA